MRYVSLFKADVICKGNSVRLAFVNLILQLHETWFGIGGGGEILYGGDESPPPIVESSILKLSCVFTLLDYV